MALEVLDLQGNLQAASTSASLNLTIDSVGATGALVAGDYLVLQHTEERNGNSLNPGNAGGYPIHVTGQVASYTTSAGGTATADFLDFGYQRATSNGGRQAMGIWVLPITSSHALAGSGGTAQTVIYSDASASGGGNAPRQLKCFVVRGADTSFETDMRDACRSSAFILPDQADYEWRQPGDNNGFTGAWRLGTVGNEFMNVFFCAIRRGTTIDPSENPTGTGSTVVDSTTTWPLSGETIGGQSISASKHQLTWFFKKYSGAGSFSAFDGNWTSTGSSYYGWGTGADTNSGVSMSLFFAELSGGTTAGTPVTATGSYAVTSTGTASTATGSYAVKTAGTPVTATGSYAVTSTGTPTTATGDYAVTSTGAVTATGSYAVTSTGTVATATGAYAVTSTGTVTTSTGSYAVTSTGTVTTATGSYAVTAAGTVSTATGSYAVTSTGTAVTATGSYDVDSTTGGSASATGSYAVIAAGTAVTATGAYAILLTGSPVTSTGSYAVQVAGSPVTATGSYSVTSSATSTATGSYAVTAAGTPVTATGSYEVSSSASGTASATGSYAVTSTGTVVTATGAYSVTVSGVTTATGSYAVLVVGTPVSATGSYAITGVTYAATPAEVFCQYAVINMEHLGYKAFRQLATLRQRTK